MVKMQNDQQFVLLPKLEWDCQMDDEVIIPQSIQESMLSYSQINSSEFGVPENQSMIEQEAQEQLSLDILSDDEAEDIVPK